MSRPTRKTPDAIEIGKLDDLTRRFEDADMSQYMIPERKVDFEVCVRRVRNLVAIDPAVLREVRRRSRARGVSCESLVNLWLQEKIASGR